MHMPKHDEPHPKETPNSALRRLKLLLRATLVAGGLLILTMLTLVQIQETTQAQGESLELTKTLNNPSPVVRVGQVVSFTVAMTNNAGFTLTNVTLIDDYREDVLAFAGALPPQDLHDPGTGVLTWTNVANPPIIQGQTLTFTVFFTAEHPQTAVVNFARAQDITGTMDAISDSLATDQIDDAVGGSTPLSKFLSQSGGPIQAGSPLTFTHIITNDGAAFITFLPLTDTYDPALIEFHFAIPTPTVTSPPGLLVWSDLVTYFGNITPFQSVVVTTVFTATGQGGDTTNRASIEGARDEFSNDLTAGQAQAPITIIGDTPTPAPTTDEGSDDDDDDTAAPTTTPVSLVTVTPAPTIIVGDSVFSGPDAPHTLPATGHEEGPPLGIYLAMLFAAGLGWLLLRKLI
jgi:uncharacterized repeat protein (TIGR01451 family)/LPXTG-motif cell wall-anchored protein